MDSRLYVYECGRGCGKVYSPNQSEQKCPECGQAQLRHCGRADTIPEGALYVGIPEEHFEPLPSDVEVAGEPLQPEDVEPIDEAVPDPEADVEEGEESPGGTSEGTGEDGPIGENPDAGEVSGSDGDINVGADDEPEIGEDL